ncbi:SDR family oxidoreductase [Azospirillum sp. 11R-A]|uniref:NAD-dependent epimerase/dehydratase family protein n=1 Tax=Azospirillum sp. 11R-A TaxID=3111634 RepID=UPI003C1DA116
MKILVTGNMGYVGPVLVRHLRARHPDANIIGFDSGFFGHCLTGSELLPEARLDAQYFGDVRTLPKELLQGVDAVVQLAAVSNDPMGNRFEAITDDINHRAAVRVAELARDCGVKRYVFASSCSMYGAAEGGPRKEADALNPLTAYARSKVATERGLQAMDRGDMVVTALRFATACGMSDRLRLDLVLNDFVACALATGEITVLSDGSPWRPLIHVVDMARAIDWALHRTADQGGGLLAVNTGSDQWNYQVRDLANAVAEAIPGTRVSINTDAPPDKRSYQVDFSLFRQLAADHQPQVTLAKAIAGLRDGLEGMNFRDAAFRNSQFMRLKVLERHMAEGRLGDDLNWIAS